ncbi:MULTISPECIES: hypothetical protein [unclassified Mesorhizobium]|uniref:hypothetical protein n=1 Tax=unclassified Mesorhizobium TaxID=325217 RepID=UPI001672BA21|nr:MULTISPECIES: hypothetical protein [unclassified Mesorhizobium]
MNLAIALIALLSVAAAAFIVAGIFMLAGMPWAFIAVGLLLFGAAVFLRSGLKPNG